MNQRVLLLKKTSSSKIIQIINKKVGYLCMTTVTKDDLIALGYPKSTAQSIIRQAKVMLVAEGKTLYLNKRLGVVPRQQVEEIIGVKIGNLNE